MKKIINIFIIIFIFSISSPFIAHAGGATLFLSPASGTYTVGRTFNVQVMINSGGGTGINASEGTINYDPSYLTVSNVSKAGSIFSLWTSNNGQGPSFSNTSGKITFGGGSPGPYSGSAGKVFNIIFSAKKIGTTKVKFSAGTILAADGKGTDIFSGSNQSEYKIIAKKEKKKVKKKETKTVSNKILPPLPEISSPTHSDKNTWYSDNNPEFDWKLLPDLTGVSFLINDSPSSDPGPHSDGIIDSHKFEGVPDGVKYFHIKYENKFGWGQIAHREFKIDATPPKHFTITIDKGGDSTNPSPKFRFQTEDKTSGIDYFDINIGDKAIKVNPSDVSKGYYQPEALLPGKYRVSIAAIDKAKNVASSSLSFIIDPLKAPIITSIPKLINKKEQLIIQGTSFYPQVDVKIFIGQGKKEPIESTVKTNDSGNWSYFHKGSLKKGSYEVWTKIIDNRGAQSLSSNRHLLLVVAPSLISTYGWWIIIILFLIIIFLIIYIVYQRKEFKEEERRIKRETDEAKDKLGKIFIALREEVDELIELADKKPGLSESERRVKEKLKESLDISEEFISKEVADIEKEIKLQDEENSEK